MTDTARSLSALQTLLADNVAEDITPQDLRDMLVSCLGIYGSISCFEYYTQQDNPDSGAKLTCFDTDGNAFGVTVDNTTDSITIDIDGNYDITFQASLYGTAGASTKFRLRINGVEQNFGCNVTLAAANGIASVSFLASGISLVATDVLTIYVEMSGSTDDFSIVDAQFTVRMIG